jgi:ketosteroid isomerase-like protein
MLHADAAIRSTNPNVAALARGYALWAESKGGSVDEVLDLMDENIVMQSLAPQEVPHPLAGTHSGKEGARAYFAALSAEWHMLDWVSERFIVDAEGDDVVVIGRCQWRHRESGREVDSPKVDIWHFEGAKATRFFEAFDTLGFAAAAGLVTL